MEFRHRVRGRALLGLCVLSVVGFAACSGSTTSGTPTPSASSAAVASVPAAPASPSAAAADSPTAAVSSPTESPAAVATSSATAVPTSIDPCQLITNDEAGKLAGATFGAGKESTTSGNARICVYGAQTMNVFTVSVAIAPDEATAKADEKAAQADLQANAARMAGQGLTLTQLPNFAPGADAVLMQATMKIGGASVGGSAIYVLRGTTFFGFSDIALGSPPPSADAVKSEAMTLLGRLP